MVNYECDICGKKFNKKSHWVTHTTNKKFPCKPKRVQIPPNTPQPPPNTLQIPPQSFNIQIEHQKVIHDNNIHCRFCLKKFTIPDNLKRHINGERCEILRLQKQQKENIFVNLLEEEKIVNQTKKELKDIIGFDKNMGINSTNTNLSMNYTDLLLKQILIINERFDTEKKETDVKIKMMTERYNELEKNNIELKKSNEKLQNKINKIVTKNKIINNTSTNTNTNTNSNNNISNTVINNPTIKLVNFGSEDLDKINYQIFIDTIKSQGAGLYNKAIEGIHFNKDYPENQNIYISDLNRERVMVYKNEKWIIDNWDTVFPELLEKVIQFGYDKNEFLKDCNYISGGKRFNIQMIKNGLRWYKLLDDNAPDIEYFELEPEDRPEIDEDTYADYLEMHEFRKKHPKKETKFHIKNKVKLNIYNKRDIPIENYKQLEDLIKKTLFIENKEN